MLESRYAQRRLLSGKQVRLNRLFSSMTGRSLVVPIDHSVSIGPLGAHNHADHTAALLADAGADAIVVHKGRARHINPANLASVGLIVHLSAGTTLSVDSTEKVLVGSVTECLALGADAVSVHVNVGSQTESRQLSDMGAVAAECERLGMPLLAMMYHRGVAAGTDDHTSPATLSHLAAIATDLGADIVKLDYAGDRAAMNKVVDSCPLPILVAGGAASGSDDSAIDFGREVAESRVAGLSFGRHIFDAHDPHLVATTLAGHLHTTPTPSRTLELA